MPEFNEEDLKKIDRLAKSYGLSKAAVMDLLEAILAGNGTMAQFDSPELGGRGQWIKEGLTMVGDMFDVSIKVKVDSLASQLAKMIEDGELTLTTTRKSSGHIVWWPPELGSPAASGSQNNIRYAYFARPRRLVVDNNGDITIYDTLDHDIYACSAKQGSNEPTDIAFTSDLGTVHLSDLKVVSKE